ncbi:MAG: hypothetical protein OHK0029_17300 [Armatimonadaceae bacterium]
MNWKKPNVFAVSLAVCTLSVSLVALSGCDKPTQTAAEPTPAPTPAGPQPPQIDYEKIRPNELGAIPVIMYHEVRGTKNANLIRSVDSFRKDLEILHKNGFYPVNMGDVVSNNINVPAGKSPVVLTFDDARPSQFQLIETADSYKVDPNSAVGVIEEFHKKHKDEWPLRGTFFVLPQSKTTLAPFGQAGLGDQKMAYLIKQGFEIGNHSTSHPNFRNLTPEQIQQEIGYAHKTITTAVPEAKIQVLALPMGKLPKDKDKLPYLLKGEFEGVPYEYQAAMKAAWRPIPSPASKEYNPLDLERIDSIDGTNGIRDWVKKLTTGTNVMRMTRYISDGDPNVVSFPKTEEAKADIARIEKQGKLANAYELSGGGAKPIVGVVEPSAPGEPRRIDTSPPGQNRIQRTASEDNPVRVIEQTGGG